MSGRTQRCSGARCWLREACRARWGVRTIRSRRTRDAPGIVAASAAVTAGDPRGGGETSAAGVRAASPAVALPVAAATASTPPDPPRVALPGRDGDREHASDPQQRERSGERGAPRRALVAVEERGAQPATQSRTARVGQRRTVGRHAGGELLVAAACRPRRAAVIWERTGAR